MKLHPASNAPSSVGQISADRMFALASGLAAAKSRQDVAAAHAFLHDDMVLENPAFGAILRGRDMVGRSLSWFFDVFPDYAVELDGHASDGEWLVCWGVARMTLTGDRLGSAPNGRRSHLPVSIRFAFRDDLIAHEIFSFDLAELCAQSGISVDIARAALFESAS